MQHTLDDQTPLILTMDDGTITIYSFMKRAMSPTLPFGAAWTDMEGVWERAVTDANVFAEISKAFPGVDTVGKPKPQPISYKVTTWDTIPTDRTYRNALQYNGALLYHDLEKAKDIHRDHIRKMRNLEMDQLDKDWMKATGQGNKKEADDVEAKRQEMRDAPALDLSSATTTEELKALWPTGLPLWKV